MASSTTKYMVEVTSGSQVKQDTVLVSVIPPPEVYAGKDTSVCRYIESVPLSGDAVNTVSVLWSSSGDGLFEDPSALITKYRPGSNDRAISQAFLTITAFPQSPCIPVSSTMHMVIDTCAGIGEEDPFPVRVNLYPNPAREKVTVEIAGFAPEELIMVLLDIRGAVLFSETLKPDTPLMVREIDLTAFTKGMAFLKLGNRKGWVVRSFVVR